ncbi:MAG: plasmid mobilization relaxosome protein MobC [Clostridium sp.]|nr:plasmid mobilization relaxosome protein MobC [Clostridium sp.]
MANRKRNIQITFYVTEEEKRLIDEKMAQLPTRRYGAYLRKMAIDGYIFQLDTTDIKRMNAALSAIGRNINQIAKRINATGSPYQADTEEIRERLDQIWQLQRRILSKTGFA